MRGEFGFAATKGDKIEGNRAGYDIFKMEYKDGAYYIKGKIYFGSYLQIKLRNCFYYIWIKQNNTEIKLLILRYLLFKSLK